ncbi:hypothetical protein [Mesorhizobium sp. CAU 1741]|uniref:hypothetical protein n=1 Tax=Mesorhizobium sp. CAU 1741 TaxID=3140366 RepID=UPI00325B2FB7
MADSDHTTTLPSVTRCEHDGTNFMALSAISQGKPGASSDPAVTVALAWTEAHASRESHCSKQQRLETQLMFGADSADAADTPCTGHRKPRVSVREAYLAAKAEETLAAGREQQLLSRLSQIQATSLTGIAAKLSVVVRESEDDTDLSDFPIDLIRSAMSDLHRIMARIGQGSAYPAAGLLENPIHPVGSSTVAAWCAFEARMRGDEERYRIWVSTYKALNTLSAD